jgi:hypothetical protein
LLAFSQLPSEVIVQRTKQALANEPKPPPLKFEKQKPATHQKFDKDLSRVPEAHRLRHKKVENSV